WPRASFCLTGFSNTRYLLHERKQRYELRRHIDSGRGVRSRLRFVNPFSIPGTVAALQAAQSADHFFHQQSIVRRMARGEGPGRAPTDLSTLRTPVDVFPAVGACAQILSGKLQAARIDFARGKPGQEGCADAVLEIPLLRQGCV